MEEINPLILIGVICLVISILFFSILIIGEISENVARENEETSSTVAQGTSKTLSDEDKTNCKLGGVFFLVIGFVLIAIGKLQSQQQKISEQILEHLQQQPRSRHCDNCKKQIPIDSNVCPYCEVKQPKL